MRGPSDGLRDSLLFPPAFRSAACPSPLCRLFAGRPPKKEGLKFPLKANPAFSEKDHVKQILKRLLILVFGASGLAGCIVGGPPGGYRLYQGGTDECGFALDSYTGEPLKWDVSRLPISFYIHESVPPEAHRNFISNVNHWNSVWAEHGEEQGVEVADMFAIVSENQVFSGRPGKDGYNMLFFITKDFAASYGAGKSTVQAVTVTFNDDSGHIVDTDILINAETIKYFYDPDYDSDILALNEKAGARRYLSSTEAPGLWASLKRKFSRAFRWLFGFFRKPETLQREVAARRVKVPRGLVDFPSLGAHELGHSPGLGHEEDKKRIGGRGLASKGGKRAAAPKKGRQSIMKRILPPGHARRNISNYDLENLFCGYYGKKGSRESL